jgi:hypothetical protein
MNEFFEKEKKKKKIKIIFLKRKQIITIDSY